MEYFVNAKANLIPDIISYMTCLCSSPTRYCNMHSIVKQMRLRLGSKFTRVWHGKARCKRDALPSHTLIWTFRGQALSGWGHGVTWPLGHTCERAPFPWDLSSSGSGLEKAVCGNVVGFPFTHIDPYIQGQALSRWGHGVTWPDDVSDL